MAEYMFASGASEAACAKFRQVFKDNTFASAASAKRPKKQRAGEDGGSKCLRETELQVQAQRKQIDELQEEIAQLRSLIAQLQKVVSPTEV